jgi:hypothetical protein
MEEFYHARVAADNQNPREKRRRSRHDQPCPQGQPPGMLAGT